jgi:hypothetical protein
MGRGQRPPLARKRTRKAKSGSQPKIVPSRFVSHGVPEWISINAHFALPSARDPIDSLQAPPALHPKVLLPLPMRDLCDANKEKFAVWARNNSVLGRYWVSFRSIRGWSSDKEDARWCSAVVRMGHSCLGDPLFCVTYRRLRQSCTPSRSSNGADRASFGLGDSERALLG